MTEPCPPILPSSSPTMRIGRAPLPSLPPLVGLDIPAEIAGYEILGELGRGGMGVVYKARQKNLGRIVALKMVLGARFAHPEDLLRFRREAETAAALQHPNIVQVHEVGTFQGQPFMVLEYVGGGTLAELMKTGRLTTAEAVPLIETLARALHVAHLRGIVHRDLKPSNILLTASPGEQHTLSDFPRKAEDTPLPSNTEQWVLKIADFGLAKHLDRDGMTETGRILGTPDYMAPEQAAGRTHEVGPGADVYALGVILYEMLARRTPFPSGPEGLLSTLSLEAPPLRRLNNKVPRDLENICHKCLEKEPQRRYESAQTLADDLRRFRDGLPVFARPATTWERFSKWCRRRPVVALLLAGLLLVTLLGFGGVSAALIYALRGWSEAKEQSRLARERRMEAEKQGRRADGEARAARMAQASEAGQRRRAEASLTFSRMAQARLEWRLNDMAASLALLEQVPRERRGWEWRYLNGLHHGELVAYDWPDLLQARSLAFSPDGRRLAISGGDPFGGDGWRVEIHDAATGQAIHRLMEVGPFPSLAYAPSGKYLAVVCWDGTLRLLDPVTGRIVRSMHPRLGPLACVTWSPDSRRIYVSGRTGHIAGIDTATGQRVMHRTQGSDVVTQVACSPCGRWLATTGGTPLILEAATGKLVKITTTCRAAAFSPDGRHLALTHGSRVTLYQAGTWVALRSLNGHEGEVATVGFSPDGQLLATAGADHVVRVWEVEDGRERSVWRGHAGMLNAVAFHPRGAKLASAGMQPGEVKMWDLTRCQEYARLDGPRYECGVEGLGFAADDKSVLVQRRSQFLELRDPVTGLAVHSGPVGLPNRWRVPGRLAAVSGDGRVLVGLLTPGEAETVSAWDQQKGKWLPASFPHKGKVWQVACDREGRLVASQSRLTSGKALPRMQLAVWEPHTGRVRMNLVKDEHVSSLALSPDGRWLARGVRFLDSDEWKYELHIHDVSAPKKMPILVQLPDCLAVALTFRADSSILAVGTSSGMLHLLDPATGHQKGKILSGAVAVEALAFHPESRLLAGASRTSVMVWDTHEGAEVLRLRGAEPRTRDYGYNPAVAWSHDGRYLAASNWNHSVSLWDSCDRTTPASKKEAQIGAAARLPRWHLVQAQEAQKRGLSAAVRFHLARLDLRADLSPLQGMERGRLHGERGNWAKALTDLERSKDELGRIGPLGWRELGCLKMWNDDWAAFRPLAEKVLHRNRSNPNSDQLADALVAACLGKTNSPAVALAEKTIWQRRLKRSGNGWQFHAVALARLRLGRPLAEVLAAIAAASKDLTWSKWAAADLLVMALAQHRAGQHNEAIATLEQAEALLAGQRATAKGEPVPPGLRWADWLHTLNLHREALRLLRPVTLRMPRPA